MKSIFRTTVATATAVIAVAATTAGTATPAVAAVPAGSISGTFTTATGAPLANAPVTIQSVWDPATEQRTYTTTTDAAGHYHSQRVVPGQYTVAFQDPGSGLTQYTRQKPVSWTADTYQVAPARTTTVDDTALPTGTVTGRFTDAAGNGLAAVLVMARDPGTQASTYAMTDESGRYSVRVFAGSYRVEFRYADRTQYAYQQLHADLGQVFVVAAGATAVVDDTAMATGSIAGRLLEPDGTPAASARVTASGNTSWQYATATTAADGSYRLDGLLPDSFQVSFTSADATRWQMAYRTIDSSKAANIPVAIGQTSTVDDTFLPTGTLVVTVTDATTGAPLPDACVDLAMNGLSRSVCGDAAGKVTIAGVPEGSGYLTWISGPDGRYNQEQRGEITITSGHTTNLAVALTPMAFIETTVRDAATGKPVSGVCVMALTLREATTAGGCSAFSDETGKIRIGYLAPGTFTLLALPSDNKHGIQWVGASAGTGDQYLAQQITVQPGQTVNGPTINLDPAGSITGTVTDAATGAPAELVCVSTVPVSATWSRFDSCLGGQTGADGRYTIDNLGPYAWPVEFAGSEPDRAGAGYAWQWSGGVVNRKQATPVPVTAGKATTANAALSPGAVVRGTVVDTTGALVPQVHVSVFNSETGDAAGAASVDLPGNGTYGINVLPQTVKIAYRTNQTCWYQNATDAEHATDVVVTADGVALTLSLFPV